MRYLIREKTRELLHATDALLARGDPDLRIATDAEVAAIAAGEPLKPIVHGAGFPVTSVESPTPSDSQAPDDTSAPPAPADDGDNAKSAQLAAMEKVLDEVKATEDKDRLEEIGRTVGIEVDKRRSVADIRKEVARAVRKAFRTAPAQG